MLNLACSLIFVPMCRNLLTYLRATEVSRLIPLNYALQFHKLVAATIVCAAAVHVGCHYADLAWRERRGLATSRATHRSYEFATGHLLVFLIAGMGLTSSERVRRSKLKVGGSCGTKSRVIGGHTVFWLVHHSWILVVFLLLVHGPHYWLWVVWPLALFSLDKLIAQKAKLDVIITRVEQPSKDVLLLRLKLASGKPLKFKPGQYILLNCPEIAKREWHPFTVSSSPETREYFSVHIRCRHDMDWTSALRERVNPDNERTIDLEASSLDLGQRDSWCASAEEASPAPNALVNKRGTCDTAAQHSTVKDVEPLQARSLPVIQVDGPYGTPAEAVSNFSTIVLVGAGIGITPFASILKTIAIQALEQSRSARPLERAALFFSRKKKPGALKRAF